MELPGLHVDNPGRRRLGCKSALRIHGHGRSTRPRRLLFHQSRFRALQAWRFRPGSPARRPARGSRRRRRTSARSRDRGCGSVNHGSVRTRRRRIRRARALRARRVHVPRARRWLAAGWRPRARGHGVLSRAACIRSCSRRSSSSGTSAGIRMVPEPGVASSSVVATSSRFEPRGRKRCAPTSAAKASYFGPSTRNECRMTGRCSRVGSSRRRRHKRETVEPRQHDVTDDGVGSRLTDCIERLDTRARPDNLMPARLQQRFDRCKVLFALVGE